MRGKKIVTRGVVLMMTTCNTAGYLLLVKHTLHPSEPKYYPTTVILITELCKLIISLIMILSEKNWNFNWTIRSLIENRNIKALSLPALIYAIQNNFLFIGLSNLDAASFQVTHQLKIISTAIFMVVILKKHFSISQWVALSLLFVGVVLVQLDSEFNVKSLDSGSKNYWLGLTVVLLSTVTSGFAGVYFEMIVKNKSITFWICNFYLYLWGVLFAVLAVMFFDYQYIQKTGFFFGYSSNVVLIIAMSAFGGLLSSIVIHQLNNIWKAFSSSAAIVLAIYGSFLFFNTHLGFIFYIGASFVCIASVLFTVL